ncbi:ABC transporter permease [Legionella wadsworthii]|uniref:ABC transporter permease n=1 Tax=Legionella wadsworthii TaxID=28088 RepID=A0A378LRA1_9GAMM|nr:hypothetical protein [Legionella wadsworthii]STY29323.1 ABC transporter permease [Legionella wadsworthii]
MPAYETNLSKQEKKWILDRRVTRLSDNKEVQIYPMGAERYLSSALYAPQKNGYDIRNDIKDKNILVIPGHGNSSFLFALAGAKSIITYDKDPVTIAWMRAFKKYYFYHEYDRKGNPLPTIGDLFRALTCWYPPLVTLPNGKLTHLLFWMLHPNSLRRVYIHYMVSLVQRAIQTKKQNNFELDKNIEFHVGTVDKILKEKKSQTFDTAFVPYLLGVENGIEGETEVINFIEQLIQLIPDGQILITPTRDIKEYYISGKSYFVTTGYPEIQEMPGLKKYQIQEVRNWFRTQGLVLVKHHSNSK